MASAFLTAILSFTSTNIDDIFVLMILYAQAQNLKEITRVTAGQYLGIVFLTLISILGAWGTQIIPPQYIGLLGFFPLLLGVRSWTSYRRKENLQAEGPENRAQIGVFSVALLTIANGADNMGVYIPVFSGYSIADFAVMLGVFAAMTALWCCLGYALASYPYIKKKIVRYQHILVPVVLILLGCSVLVKNYVF